MKNPFKKEEYKPMQVVDLMNDLERDNNFKERIKQQLSKPITKHQQLSTDFGRNTSGARVWTSTSSFRTSM